MEPRRTTLLLDLTLLMGTFLIVGTTIFISLDTNDFFIDLTCLLISVLLIIITYFTGITAGLTFSLIFIFIQLTYVVYQYAYHNVFSYGLLFWLVMPPIYCLTIYAVTYQIRTIQEENIRLRKETTRLNTLDSVTNLRTAKMYEEGFDLFSEVSTRYNVPLYMAVIRVAYWESIRNLMNLEQKKELLQLVTAAISDTTDGRYLPYFIESEPPTWSLLIFREGEDPQSAKIHFKEDVQEKIVGSELLSNLTITLQVSYTKYDPAEFNNASEFLGEGINSLQYDV